MLKQTHSTFCVPVLSVSHLLTYHSKQPYEISTVNSPILQLKKLRQNVVKILAQKPYRQ